MNTDELIKLVYRKDFSSLDEILSDRGNVNAVDNDGRTLLMHATLASNSDPKMITYLIEHGANVNAKDNGQKWAALHFAGRDQKLGVVEALLEFDVDVDAEDSFGNTALWRTVMTYKNQSKIVELLLNKGADPNKKNKHGVSPKDLAERLRKDDLLGLFS